MEREDNDRLVLFNELANSLRERVFFAARDGMSLTLYALLYEKKTDEIDDLLNNVSFQNIFCVPIQGHSKFESDS